MSPRWDYSTVGADRSNVYELEKTTSAKLPPFDRALRTRNYCIFGIGVCWAATTTCVALGIWAFTAAQNLPTGTDPLPGTGSHSGQPSVSIGVVGQALVKLAVNICIMLVTDCLGCIHTASVRWALWREGRLDFNSNPRMLTGTKTGWSTHYFTNIAMAFFLMLLFAASSQLFLQPRTANNNYNGFVVNGVAFLALAVGIAGQALIATVALRGSSRLIPTWSSNPLNTALTCIHEGLDHHPGRSLVPVDRRRDPSTPQQPARKQANALRAVPHLRWSIAALWLIFAITFIWAIIIIIISRYGHIHSETINIQFFGSFAGSASQNSPVVPFYHAWGGDTVSDGKIVAGSISALFITLALQIPFTLSLHAAELVMHVYVDEQIWRKASTLSGLTYMQTPIGNIVGFFGTWQTLFLFILNPVTHWLFGVAVFETKGTMYMSWEGLLYLAIPLALLAVVVTCVAVQKPRGPQPAAYGHLQTLVDLISLSMFKMIDRTFRAEAIRTAWAAAHAIGPKVYATDCKSGAFAMECLKGNTLSTEMASQSLPQILDLLRKIHMASAQHWMCIYNPITVVEEYLESAKGMTAMPLEDIQLVETVLDDVRREIGQIHSHPDLLVPCHNDFHSHNIIVEHDGNHRHMAIDFENADLGDPMWDLAYFTVNLELEREPLALASAYSTTMEERRRLSAHCLMAIAHCATWSAIQGAPWVKAP
ncbi:MAG: hypothetical protein Q9157_002226 [Trypethelium eluteriae]